MTVECSLASLNVLAGANIEASLASINVFSDASLEVSLASFNALAQTPGGVTIRIRAAQIIG